MTEKTVYAIAFKSAEVSVEKGNKLTLELQKTNLEDGEKVTLTSSAEGTVTVVDNDAMTIEGVAAGEATITATVAKNEKHEALTATCKVVVKKKPLAVEDAVLSSIAVTPNPFGEQLRILNPEMLVGYYELVNAFGVVIRSGWLEGSVSHIDTEALTAGLYFVRVTGKNGVKRTIRVVRY